MAKPPGYVEVSERIQEWRAAYPDGSLQAEIVELRDDLVIVKAYAYRTPDDQRPGTGLASEPIPGKTNFTRDSELMNCETSAWGRALIAVGAADANSGIASANEVRNRQETPAPEPTSATVDLSELEGAILTAQDLGLEGDWEKTRGYARQSQAHADMAVAKLAERMDGEAA